MEDADDILYPYFSWVDFYIVTILVGLNFIFVVGVDVYMIVRHFSGSKVARTRSVLTIVLTNVGCTVYNFQHIGYLFKNGPEPLMSIFFIIGFPLMFVPPLVRAWRITCCLYKTWDWKLMRFRDPVLDPPRGRGSKWFLLRLGIILTPFYGSFPFMFFFRDVGYYMLPYRGFIILLLLLVGVSHWKARARLDPFDLNQSNWIIAYSLVFFLFYATDSVLWYYVKQVLGEFYWPTYILIPFFPTLAVIVTLPHLIAMIKEHRKELEDKKNPKSGVELQMEAVHVHSFTDKRKT